MDRAEGSMVIIVLAALPYGHSTKKETKMAMSLSCVEAVRAENSRGNGFCRRSSPTSLFDPLKKTSDNEHSCAENVGNASIHDQHSGLPDLKHTTVLYSKKTYYTRFL
jgi:hypothetical protein